MAINREAVDNALAQIKPILQRDGGDIELVDITEDDIVQVRLQGHCAGCPGAAATDIDETARFTAWLVFAQWHM